MDTEQEHSAGLPVRCDLTLTYALSFAIAVLMAVASVAGLLRRAVLYPTDELLRSFVPNDVINILIGVPILLGSMWLARRGKLIGLLFWPGALFYVLYNYLIYVFAMPLNVAFLLHLVLVTLCVYTLIGLIAGIDGRAVHHRLAGAVPERLAGGVLVGLGLLFLLQSLLTTAPFALADVVVISIMGLICFVPFGLFVRGVVSKGKR